MQWIFNNNLEFSVTSTLTTDEKVINNCEYNSIDKSAVAYFFGPPSVKNTSDHPPSHAIY